ncbi:MAG: lipoyl synthase [Planctomycetota bacterium]
MMPQFPDWLRKRVPTSSRTEDMRNILESCGLSTVCRQARCPNQGECFARGTATFMILGETCTRNCSFCAVRHGTPASPEPDEPERLAEAVGRLGLDHAVVTSVTRDDLPDGGSGHFAAAIRRLHATTDATVEVLTPDFRGCSEDVRRVLEMSPEVFNHNVETVPRFYPRVRPQADYSRSLSVLEQAADRDDGVLVKSGLMVGLGETDQELMRVFGDLLEAGSRLLTIGQYLQPTPDQYATKEFVHPDRFRRLRSKALAMGFHAVASAPFVRSSYRARELAARACRWGG